MFPQTEIAGDRGAVRTFGEARRVWATPICWPTTTCSGPIRTSTASSAGPTTSTARSMSRCVLFAYLAGLHQPGARHLDHHRPATPDRAGGQAGGRGGPAQRGPVPARPRARLEPRRVRGARAGLQHPGRRLKAQVRVLRQLWTEPRVVRRPLPPHRRRRSGAAAGPAADPDLDRRPRPRPPSARRPAGRRLVPTGPTRAVTPWTRPWRSSPRGPTPAATRRPRHRGSGDWDP